MEKIIILLLLLSYYNLCLFILTFPLLYLYSYLHRRKSLSNVKGNESEISLLNGGSKYIYLKRLMLNYVDGYYRYWIFNVSKMPSHFLRKFLYKNIFLVRMDVNSVIYFGAELRAPYLFYLGKGSIIGDNCILDARSGGIYIGDNVNVGSRVSFWTDQHDYNDPFFRSMPNKRGSIKIGNRVWIGPNVTILHNVTIGEGAVIAAGSVVVKDVEPFSIMGGVPAKKIAIRTTSLKYKFSGSHLHFY